MLVLRKLSDWPGLHPKYSGKLAGKYAAELLAVTSTLVLSMVAHTGSVETTRTCRVWVPKAVVLCVAELPDTAVTIDRASLDAGWPFPKLLIFN